MKKHTLSVFGFGAFVLLLSLSLSAQTNYELPGYMKIDLKRLEETWNVLDQYADKIWPGWNNYREVPFRFSYPNGVEMLVGHPDPPDSFELIEGFAVQGKRIHVDRSSEISLVLKPPLGGGGGVLPFGKNKPISIVDLKMWESTGENARNRIAVSEDARAKDMPEEYYLSSENQILLNIHELFHCYQRNVYRYRYGNFRANPNANYAIHAEIEGRALERAFLESAESNSRRYLMDFVVARELKRKDLLELERNQESEDDQMEGTAVYAETRALYLIKSGYKPYVAKSEDPYYLGFKYVDALLDEKLDYLRRESRTSLDARGKCYPYGCFQALLLSRLFPGWQKDFFENKRLLDQVIAEKLNMSPQEKASVTQELLMRYPYEEIVRRNTGRVEKRDHALKVIQERKGRVYVINLKPTEEILRPQWRGESYEVGLMRICLEVLKRIQIRDVLLEGRDTPVMQDQLYYIKWIDTETPIDQKGYSIEYRRKEGENIFYGAVFQTKGFTLEAPKIQVKDLKNRVKVSVLLKIEQ
jgi:hypothetical protein